MTAPVPLPVVVAFFQTKLLMFKAVPFEESVILPSLPIQVGFVPTAITTGVEPALI